MKRLLLISVLMLSLMASVNAISITSPKDGFNTAKNSIVFRWTGWQGNGSSVGSVSYRIILYRDKALSDIIASTTVNDNYVNLTNLKAGEYYYNVEALAGNRILNTSSQRKFTIHGFEDDFSVKVNASTFDEGGYVTLNLNVPSGAEVNLEITGNGEDIKYNPKDIKNPKLLVRLEKAGVYELDAEMIYYDITRTLSSKFKTGSTYTPTSVDEGSSTDDTAGVSNYMLIIRTENDDEPLGVVSYSYRLSNGNIEFGETAKDGNSSLTLPEGIYDFTFFKTGYEEASKRVALEDDLDVTIPLSKIAEPEKSPQQVRSDYRIEILNPENNSRFNYNVVGFSFSVGTAKKLRCILLINEELNSGWEVHAVKENVVSGGEFNSMPLDSGYYKAMVKCETESDYDESDMVYFRVGSTVQREDLTTDLKNWISELKKEIGALDPDMQALFEKEGINQELADDTRRLKDIDDEYNALLSSDKTNEEINSEKDGLAKEIEGMSEKVPDEITFYDAHEAIIYLPRPGFEEVLKNCSDAAGEKYNAKDVKKLQENILVRERIDHINFQDRALTKVSKDIDGMDKLAGNGDLKDNFVIVQYIPDSIQGNPEFLTPARKISDNFYEIDGDATNIEYYFRDDVQNDLLQGTVTLILPKGEGVNEAAPADAESNGSSSDGGGGNLITGAAVSDYGGMAGSILLYIIVFAVVMIGGSFFIPGTPTSKIFRKDPEKQISGYLNYVIDSIEKEGVKKTQHLFPKALDLFEMLPAEKRDDFLPMINYLSMCLEKESISDELKILGNKINFQRNLYAFDPDMYRESAEMLNNLVSRYEALDPGLKEELGGALNSAYNDLESLRKKG